ncbi:MAG: CRISPR system precrRNA processing endoribonuclease RAMP protein Cas6 [Candidatus Cloacimonetes bacterium]|nr:CRISPR system precrRNA processing endoribonuclease RAMP protein Cas6 [Candidatus Cloacimonadota bacterium]
MDFLDLQIVFQTDDTLAADADFSSAIRGLWGRSLKRIYCFQKQLDCIDCSLENCTYYVLFEKKLNQSEQYHPYIIQAYSSEPGLIVVKLSLFGWICQHYDKLLYSILNLEGNTLYRSGKRFTLSLESIHDANKNCLYQKGSSSVKKPCIKSLQYRPQLVDCIQLVFQSPLRQKYQGTLMHTFVWEAFAKSLINRIRHLDTYFNHGKLQIPADIDIANVQVLNADTRWDEKPRLSFRQDAHMSIGGLVGIVELRGISSQMLGILKLARYLHAGKQTTFGNGKIVLKKCQDI